MARIVILNGVSSSGKTSIARSIQQRATEDFVRLALDDFISTLPIGRETGPDWFPARTSSDQAGPLVSIASGIRGAMLLRQMRVLAKGLAEAGIDVVVDDVCTAQDIAEYRLLLADHRCVVVKVDADLATIAEREKLRGDRLIGLAREQYGRIHEGVDYDLVVANRDGHVEQCADAILAALGAR